MGRVEGGSSGPGMHTRGALATQQFVAETEGEQNKEGRQCPPFS